MELGATICSPLNPSCSTCPVLGQCRAFSESKHSESVKVTDYPMKVVKAKPRHESAAICVVEILRDQEISEGTPPENGIFLLVKRPEKGLLAGLWEFPSVLVDGAVDLTTRREAIDQFLKESFTLDPRKTCSIVFREDVGELVHIFTHIRLKMYVEMLVLNLKGVRLLMNSLSPSETHIKFMVITLYLVAFCLNFVGSQEGWMPCPKIRIKDLWFGNVLTARYFHAWD